jgi:hypothetical protein
MHFRLDDATLALWNAQHTPVMSVDDEWALVAPYLALMTEDIPQREHSMREVFEWPALDCPDGRRVASAAP